MAAQGQGNPAVVGLAGFGMTTLILQFHNLGWCGVGPVLALAFVFGGAAQLIAGYQEFKCGNNFGYSAFVSYGAFWISLGTIWMLNHFQVYTLSTADIGYFLVVWTLYTAMMWFAALRIHGAMASTFTLLLIGFIGLDLVHFGFPALKTPTSLVLILCALNAWYMMAAAIYAQVFDRQVLPLGKPWISASPRWVAEPLKRAA